MRKFRDKTANVFSFLLRLGKAILRRLDGRKQIVTVWLLVILSTTTFTGYALSLTTAKLEYKNAISVFNLGDSDLIYQEGETVFNIPTFDSYYQIIKENKNFTLSKSDVKKDDKEFTYKDKESKLYIYIASEDNRYCFISADVTSVYYDNGDDTNQAQGITILTTDPTPNLEVLLDWNKYDYVFPGRYFPSQINYNSSGKKLMGYYPIECKSITDTKAVTDIIAFYKTFRAEVERELLENEIKKLQE